MCCNSFNSLISPSFRFQRFYFKGKSVRLKWRIKTLFANWPSLTLSLLQANGPQPPIFLNNYQGAKMAVIINQNMHAQ